jgi:predicted NUDIX family phosphoesterase
VQEEVLVFRSSLLENVHFGGSFVQDPQLVADIISESFFVEREKAETEASMKQIIPYSILRHERSVFRYLRSGWEDEARLRGRYSIGVGGHINKRDLLPLLSELTSIVEWARDREVFEEFEFDSSEPPQLVGVIDDNSDKVGQVHFGVVYEYWLRSPNVRPRERRKHTHCQFVSVQDLIQTAGDYENWSRIIINSHLARI